MKINTSQLTWCCLITSIGLAIMEVDGWGWFLIAAFWFRPSSNEESPKEEEAKTHG